MDIQAIRKEYENTGIHEAQLPGDPIGLFREWYQLAVDNCPGTWFEPNTMALATSGPDGSVTNRIVLMKQVVDEGIYFFTNYDSVKGRQIEANPQAAIAIHWPYLGRQVRMQGLVEKTTREVSEQYFHSRPRGSQIGAAASQQSRTVSRKELDEERIRLVKKFEGQPVPLPENWGGYVLKANHIEFWQGRLDRLHDRIVYRLGTDWNWTRLSP